MSGTITATVFDWFLTLMIWVFMISVTTAVFFAIGAIAFIVITHFSKRRETPTEPTQRKGKK